jgi:hypothetical protein
MYACKLCTTFAFVGNKFLVRVFLRLFSTGLAWTGSVGEIRCCHKAVHIRRHRGTDKKTKPSISEVVPALLLQDIQKLRRGSENASVDGNV